MSAADALAAEAEFWRQEAEFLTECALRLAPVAGGSPDLGGPAAAAQDEQDAAGGDEQG